MSYVQNGDLLGLPILSHEETSHLTERINTDLADIAGAVYFKRRLIAKIIDTDIETFREEATNDIEISEEEADKHINGIQLGYDFAVGVLSTVQYMRSPFRTFNKFIKNTKHTDTLPVRTKSQQERLVALVSGEVYVEPILNPIYSADTPLSEYHLREYRSASDGISIILDQKSESLRTGSLGQMSEEQSSALVDGLEHGVAHGTELYIQSWQQAELDKIQTPIPGELWDQIVSEHYEATSSNERRSTDQADDQY